MKHSMRLSLKVILEARIGARLKEVQGDVFRVMLDWHRDVTDACFRDKRGPSDIYC